MSNFFLFAEILELSTFVCPQFLSLSADKDSHATKTLRSGRPHLALAINVNNYILLITFYNCGRAWK